MLLKGFDAELLQLSYKKVRCPGSLMKPISNASIPLL